MVSDPNDRELVLTTLHPGVTREQVKGMTGWALRVAPVLETTPVPTVAELAALRDLHARTAAAHGGSAITE
jgi:glutaconate CoA-transferase subunit B